MSKRAGIERAGQFFNDMFQDRPVRFLVLGSSESHYDAGKLKDALALKRIRRHRKRISVHARRLS